METTKVFQKTYDLYKHVYENLRTLPKRERYTWGQRCDTMTLKVLELTMRAGMTPLAGKRVILHELSNEIDLLKIWLRLGNELRILDHQKYIAREGELVEIGKMIGGWMKTVT